MKNRWKKFMMIAGAVSVLGTAVYGCGGNAEETGSRQEESPEEDTETEPQEETAGGKEPSGTADAEHTTESSALEELSGDIYEIGDMQFVVNEITVMEGEDDSEIMVIGAPGNEEDMNLITVTYDENTRFYKRTIRNGGADYEDSGASSEDLEKGMTAERAKEQQEVKI